MSANILVIDDETNIRTMIRLTLEHSGYHVDTAADGSQGLALFKAGKTYDLVLVDYRMPGMTGTDVQKEIAKLAPKTHVIIVTAHGTIDMAMDAIHAGATDFLRKPFSADTLRQSVASALTIQKTATNTNMSFPIDKIVKPFSRTNINGFCLQVNEEAHGAEPEDGSIRAHFLVHRGDQHHKVEVIIQGYVIELAKAYLDLEEVPGGESFWKAMGEESLAEYLWKNAELPEHDELEVKELNRLLEHWLDSVSSVQLHVQ